MKMETKEVLEKVKKTLEKKVNIKKSPRIEKNLKIIDMILDWFSYEEIAAKLWVTRQAIWSLVNNSKKLLEIKV